MIIKSVHEQLSIYDYKSASFQFEPNKKKLAYYFAMTERLFEVAGRSEFGRMGFFDTGAWPSSRDTLLLDTVLQVNGLTGYHESEWYVVSWETEDIENIKLLVRLTLQFGFEVFVEFPGLRMSFECNHDSTITIKGPTDDSVKRVHDILVHLQ